MGSPGALKEVSPALAEERALVIARRLRAAARKSSAPTVFVSGGGGFAARRGAKLFFYGLIASFVALVAIPVSLASLYFGVIASDQYATELRFALQSGQSSPLDSLTGLVGVAGSQQTQDSQVIIAFIQSRAMVEKIDQALGFRKLYERPEVDALSRLDSTDQIERIVKYWNRRIDAKYDSTSNIISVEVRAFSPQDSLAVAKTVLKASEELANQLTERARQDSMRQSKVELDQAQLNLTRTSEEMRNLRDSEGILDAAAVAEASTKVITAVKIELSKLEADYATRIRLVNAEAPQMRILATQIANLKEQIQSMNAQLASNASVLPEIKSRFPAIDPASARQPSQGRTLSASMNLLERKQVEVSLAQKRYALAAASYETARLDSSSQHAYLNSFVEAVLAQEAIYPKRWWDWTIIVVPDIMIWLTLVGISFAVRDHLV